MLIIYIYKGWTTYKGNEMHSGQSSDRTTSKSISAKSENSSHKSKKIKVKIKMVKRAIMTK